MVIVIGNSASGNLIAALRAHNRDAWQQLVDCYEDRLLKDITISLRRRGLNNQACEDIAQDTWITAMSRIEIFHGEDTELLYHWLRRISFNLVRNYARQSRPTVPLDKAHRVVESASDTPRLNGRTNSIEDIVVYRERAAEASRALAQLNHRDREILIRRYLWQQMPTEIAQHIPGLKSRSISQRLMRVRKQLNATLREIDSD